MLEPEGRETLQMHIRPLTGPTLGALVCFFATACSGPSGDQKAVGAVTEAVTTQAPPVSVSARSISYDFTEVAYLPAGVSAGRDVIFIGDPL